MAIVSKTNRDGIDVVIENLQQKFYANLLGFWTSGVTYQMYPRANKNYKDDQLIPEVSIDEKDYSEVLTSDKFDITSFFLIDDERTFHDDTKRITQIVSIIFQADLVALYGLTERADEKFNMDILRVLKKDNFYITSADIKFIEGIDKVYSELSLSGELKEQIKPTDMSSFHVLRCDFEVIYKPNCNIQLTPVCAGVSVSVDGAFSQVVPAGGTYNCVTGGGGSFTYYFYIDGVDTGQDVVIDGTDIDIEF